MPKINDKIQKKAIEKYGAERVLKGITLKRGLPASVLASLVIALAIIFAGGAVMITRHHDFVVAARDK